MQLVFCNINTNSSIGEDVKHMKFAGFSVASCMVPCHMQLVFCNVNMTLP